MGHFKDKDRLPRLLYFSHRFRFIFILPLLDQIQPSKKTIMEQRMIIIQIPNPFFLLEGHDPKAIGFLIIYQANFLNKNYLINLCN